MGWTDMLERLKQAVGLTDRQVAAMEKRRAFRVSRRVALRAEREGGEIVSLAAANFGPRGVRVETPARLRRGERVTLHRVAQPEEQGASSPAPTARVVWVRKRKTGTLHDAGLTFETDTDARAKAAAAFLVNECRVGLRDARESRGAPRVTADIRGSLMTPDCRTFDVVVRDIAIGGALLLSPRPVNRNTAVDLKVRLPHANETLVCHGTVVRSMRTRNGGCELGIAFSSVSEHHRERLIDSLSKMLADFG